jgi:hypothetical protein
VHIGHLRKKLDGAGAVPAHPYRPRIQIHDQTSGGPPPRA